MLALTLSYTMQVAQQVMGLFKGALDLQNDLEALEQDKMAENNFKDSTSNKSLEQKSQVISSSNGVVQNVSNSCLTELIFVALSL